MKLISQASDDATRKQEEEANQYMFKAETDEYIRRTRTFRTNCTNAYALLWERCSWEMQRKLETRKDFELIYRDPIGLLKAIKESCINYEENRYPLMIVRDTLRSVMNTRQKEGESLSKYTQRFRTAVEVLESHVGGPLALPRIAETMKEWKEFGDDTPDTVKETQDECFTYCHEALMALIYLENADKTKYASLVDNLSSQYALGNDQFPKDVTKAMYALSSHKVDTLRFPIKSLVDKALNGKKGGSDKDKGKDKEKTKTDDKEELPLSFAQYKKTDIICYCCGESGHRSTDCSKSSTPKSEWYIQKLQQSHAQAEAKKSKGDDSESTAATKSWAHAQVSMKQSNGVCEDAMRDWILLDNQSTASIFCNPKLVNNVRSSTDILDECWDAPYGKES